MKPPIFRSIGARQATKQDLIDVLCALDADVSVFDARESRWTVDALRTAVRIKASQVVERFKALKADRDDYEQRWLAECRAHGEARRHIEALIGKP